MTVNKEEEKEGEAVDIDMPADLPMYCVKTLQETSASVFRMVSPFHGKTLIFYNFVTSLFYYSGQYV